MSDYVTQAVHPTVETPCGRWPTHVARAFQPLLDITRNPVQVYLLLDLLAEIEADRTIVTRTVAGCLRRGSVTAAIAYYSKLASQLDEVTHDRPEDEITFGSREPRCIPRFTGSRVEVGAWRAG